MEPQEEKKRFIEFLKANTPSEEEALIYFRLCSFIDEHGDGRVRADFHNLFTNDTPEHIDERVDEAVRLLKKYRNQ